MVNLQPQLAVDYLVNHNLQLNSRVRVSLADKHLPLGSSPRADNRKEVYSVSPRASNLEEPSVRASKE